MSILVACDGSSLRSLEGETGKGPIGWAWAREDEHWYANGDIVGTNQKAELLGLLGVLLLNPKEHLIIQLDSKYALNTAETWMWGWAKKGWRKADGKPIINLEVIQQIHTLMLARNNKIDFQWVKGHDLSRSNPLNHKADELATMVSGKVKESLKNNNIPTTFYHDSKGRDFNQHEHNVVTPLLYKS
jgi:ribonuclease HI